MFGKYRATVMKCVHAVLVTVAFGSVVAAGEFLMLCFPDTLNINDIQ